MENLKEKTVYYGKRYAQEVSEALLALSIVKLISKQKYLNIEELSKLIKLSLLVGFITLILEEINPQIKDSVKQGLTAGVGSSILKSVN